MLGGDAVGPSNEQEEVLLRGGKEQNYGYLCTACVQGDFKSCSSCGALYHCREGGDVITKSGMNFGFYCGTCCVEIVDNG